MFVGVAVFLVGHDLGRSDLVISYPFNIRDLHHTSVKPHLIGMNVHASLGS